MGVAGLKELGPRRTEITTSGFSPRQPLPTELWQVAAQRRSSGEVSKWKNVHEDYYSSQDAEQAITIGEAILDAYRPDHLQRLHHSGQLRLQRTKGYDARRSPSPVLLLTVHQVLLRARHHLQLGPLGLQFRALGLLCYSIPRSCLTESRLATPSHQSIGDVKVKVTTPSPRVQRLATEQRRCSAS